MITALIASDKGYLIINPFGIIEGETDFSFYYNPENLTMWKVKGVKNTIMAYEGDMRDADLIRYINLFKGDLTSDLIIDSIIPKIKNIYAQYGRLNDEKQFDSYFYILQNNRGYCIKKNGVVYPIIRLDSSYGEDYIQAYLVENKKYSEIYRVLTALRGYNEYLGKNFYPVVILDTKTGKFKYIRNEEKLWELA